MGKIWIHYGNSSKYGAKVTFINLPSKYLLKYSGGSGEVANEYKKLEAKLKEISEKGNAGYISFFDYILIKKTKKDLLFFPCDFHYSNYGESLLADFIKTNYQK